MEKRVTFCQRLAARLMSRRATALWLPVVAALLLLSPLAARAQADPVLTQFYEVPTFYNPAAVGSSDLLRIRAAGRLQWVGIDNAPQTYLLAADTKLKLFGKWFGLGAMANIDQAGLFFTTNIGLQLAFKLKFKGGVFTFGVQPGFLNLKFKGSEVFIPDDDDYHQSNDEGIPTRDIGGSAFDLGAGLWYSHSHWHAGVSLQHAINPTVKFSDTNSTSSSSSSSSGNLTSADGEAVKQFQLSMPRTLYFQAGGNIQLRNTLFELLPSVFYYTDFTFHGGEAMLRARYNKFVSAGVGYRWDDAVVATIGADVKGFFIGFSYDYALTDIHRATPGSFELVAGYSMKLDFGEKNRNRHKSVRIL